MKRILFVDHEPAERSIFRWELAGHYRVLEAASAVESINICRKRSGVDLLICDSDLGLVSGMELASLLRGWNSNLRTILTSRLPLQNWTERQQLQLKELPPEDVLILERPFSTKDLKAAITKLLPEELAVASGAGASL